MRELWIGVSLILASYVLTAVSIIVLLFSHAGAAFATYLSSWAVFIYGTFLGGRNGIIMLKNRLVQKNE